MKKLTALLITFAMLLSLCMPVTAKAAETIDIDRSNYCVVIGDEVSGHYNSVPLGYDILYGFGIRLNQIFSQANTKYICRDGRYALNITAPNFVRYDEDSSYDRNGFANNEFAKQLQTPNWSGRESVKYVLVAGGSFGDVLSNANITEETVRTGMINFQNKVRKIYPNAKILYTPFSLTVTPKGGDKEAIERMRQISLHQKLYSDVAESLGWGKMDKIISSIFFAPNNQNLFASDGYHLTQEGTDIVADAIISSLCDLRKPEIEEEKRLEEERIAKEKAEKEKAARQREYILKFKMSEVGQNSIKLAFSTTKPSAAAPSVAKYELYGNRLDIKLKKIATFTGKQKSTNRKNLAKGTAYHFQLKAFDKTGKNIATSREIVITTQGSKYTNITSVQAPAKLTVNKKQSVGLSAKEVAYSASKPSLKKHKDFKNAYSKIRYFSDAPGIVSVDENGKITANEYSGTANIYSVGLSGVYATTKITVK